LAKKLLSGNVTEIVDIFGQGTRDGMVHWCIGAQENKIREVQKGLKENSKGFLSDYIL
jgi:arginine decarboxylase-like protein